MKMTKVAFLLLIWFSLYDGSIQQCPPQESLKCLHLTKCPWDGAYLLQRYTTVNGIECPTPCSICAGTLMLCPPIPCESRRLPPGCRPKIYKLYTRTALGDKCNACDTFTCD